MVSKMRLLSVVMMDTTTASAEPLSPPDGSPGSFGYLPATDSYEAWEAAGGQAIRI